VYGIVDMLSDSAQVEPHRPNATRVPSAGRGTNREFTLATSAFPEGDLGEPLTLESELCSAAMEDLTATALD
jgi:hypothetical protein